MSGDDDAELRDLLVQTLERNGTLAKIRAQLRASVFLALGEQESQKKRAPLFNEKAKRIGDSENGRLCAELVADFLDTLGLDAASSVFAAEFQLGDRRSRSNLAAAVNLSSNAIADAKPLLCSLLETDERKARATSAKDTPLSTTEESVSIAKVNRISTDTPVNGAEYLRDGVLSVESSDDDDFFGGSSKKSQKSGLVIERPTPFSVNVTSKDKSNERTKTSANEPTTKKDDQKIGSSLSFLGDLPALSKTSRPALPPATKAKAPMDADFMKLLGDSLEDNDQESSPNSSGRLVPGLDLKKLDPKNTSLANSQQKSNAAENASDSGKPSESTLKQRKDSSPEEEISEEIAEDLEVDDLLDSTRSSRQLSF